MYTVFVRLEVYPEKFDEFVTHLRALLGRPRPLSQVDKPVHHPDQQRSPDNVAHGYRQQVAYQEIV